MALTASEIVQVRGIINTWWTTHTPKIVKHRRGAVADMPALLDGEIFFADDENGLYVGEDGGPPHPIGGTDPNAIHDNVAGEIAAIAAKANPVGADILIGEDSAAGNAKIRMAVSSLPYGGKTYDLLVDAAGNGDYTTVGEALQNANAGDIIAVAPGTYVEDRNWVFPQGVVVIGLGHGRGNLSAEWPIYIDLGDYVVTLAEGAKWAGMTIEVSPSDTTARVTSAEEYVTLKDLYFISDNNTVSRFFQISGNYQNYDNLRFNGNDYCNRALNLNGCQHSVFRNMEFYNFNCTADSVVKSTSSGECVFQNLYFYLSSTGSANNPCIEEVTEVAALGGHIYDNIRITGRDKCTFGIQLVYENSIVNGGYIEGCEKGIRMQSYSQVVNEVTFYDCSEHGIYVISVGTDDYAHITNCILDTCGTNGNSGTGGIHSTTRHVKITATHIYDTPATARDVSLAGDDNILTAVTGEGTCYISADDTIVGNCEFSTIQTAATADRTVIGPNVRVTTFTDGGNHTKRGMRVHVSAASDPTINDDEGDGYRYGDVWINLGTPEAFMCMDPSAGAADWDTITGIAAHAATHENGGADEISVAGLSGELADDQPPKAHAADHENGGGDEISVAGLSGELADDQPPKNHAADHKDGGGDEILLNELGEPTGAVEINDQKINNIGASNYNVKTVTIAGGSFAYTSDATVYFVNGQGGVADDLTDVTGIADGELIVIAYAGEVITIKSLGGGAGYQFRNRSGGDIVINGNEDAYMFIGLNGELIQLG